MPPAWVLGYRFARSMWRPPPQRTQPTRRRTPRQRIVVSAQRLALSARYAFVIVFGAQLLAQRKGFREPLRALHGTVRHIGYGLPFAIHLRDIGAFRHEIENRLVVAARGGVVQRRVAIVIHRVDVSARDL